MDASAVMENVRAVRERIARAADRSGRDPAAITLVAAAKRQSAALVRAAIEAGVTDIGENYVQEAVEKRAAVGVEARWHLIGHLQRNKVGRVVRDFEVVQSIDRAEIAVALARRCEAEARHLSVFIEVKLGDEPTKHGASPDELAELAAAIRSLEPLSLQGLMAIPPGGTAEEARPYFRRLRVAAEDLGLRGLSMGMTDDFETAIEEGATIVRVGRAIFGDRR